MTRTTRLEARISPRGLAIILNASVGLLSMRLIKGQKRGAALLWDAVARASRYALMVYALLVDAKDDRAGAFYLCHGCPLLQSRLLLLQPAKVT